MSVSRKLFVVWFVVMSLFATHEACAQWRCAGCYRNWGPTASYPRSNNWRMGYSVWRGWGNRGGYGFYGR